MTTYNTGNPIGSKDPRDLYDNAENLDTAVNDINSDTWKDRLGRSRKTMSGMEREFDVAQALREHRFNTFLESSAYQFLGDYAAGIEITEYNQIIRDADGEFWRLSGQVELPYTTTGDWGAEEALFVAVGDAALRQDLANPDMGAAIVARGVVAVDSIADLLALPDEQRKEGLLYLVKGYHTGSSVGGGEFYWDAESQEEADGGTIIGDGAAGRWVRSLSSYVTPEMFGAHADGVSDDTAPLRAAAAHIDATRRALHLDAKTYLITGTITFSEPPTIRGASYSPHVIGRNYGTPYPIKNTVILCDTGADWAISVDPGQAYKRGLHLTDFHVLGVSGKTAKAGLLIRNCGWGGYVRGVLVERFDGIGVYLSQVQDTLFDQLEVVDCGVDGVNPALFISDYSNLLSFNRLRLENNNYQMQIAGGFGFEFHSPHFEQGDYPGTEEEVGDLLNINSTPSIRLQATSMVKFFGGLIIGATAARQMEKFGFTSASQCPYHMTVGSDCTDVALHGTTIGFGYNNGRAISFHGEGGLFGCELIGLSPDAPAVDITNANAKLIDCTLRIFDGGYNNTMWCVEGGEAEIRGNTFVCDNATAADKTVGAIISGSHALGDNTYKVAKYNLISDNSVSSSSNINGTTYANLTGGVDLRKFNKNTLLRNTTPGTMTVSGMTYEAEYFIKNSSGGSMTIPHGGGISLVGSVDAELPPGAYIRFYADPESYTLVELFRRV